MIKKIVFSWVVFLFASYTSFASLENLEKDIYQLIEYNRSNFLLYLKWIKYSSETKIPVGQPVREDMAELSSFLSLLLQHDRDIASLSTEYIQKEFSQMTEEGKRAKILTLRDLTLYGTEVIDTLKVLLSNLQKYQIGNLSGSDFLDLYLDSKFSGSEKAMNLSNESKIFDIKNRFNSIFGSVVFTMIQVSNRAIQIVFTRTPNNKLHPKVKNKIRALVSLHDYLSGASVDPGSNELGDLEKSFYFYINYIQKKPYQFQLEDMNLGAASSGQRPMNQFKQELTLVEAKELFLNNTKGNITPLPEIAWLSPSYDKQLLVQNTTNDYLDELDNNEDQFFQKQKIQLDPNIPVSELLDRLNNSELVWLTNLFYEKVNELDYKTFVTIWTQLNGNSSVQRFKSGGLHVFLRNRQGDIIQTIFSLGMNQYYDSGYFKYLIEALEKIGIKKEMLKD